jgi:hypothetical protein
MTTFNVTMNVSSMEGKSVLVFLKPLAPQRNYLIHAWQNLNASAGATESFEYEANISTCVTSVGLNPSNTVISKTESVVPGQLLQAVSPNGLSPKLEKASTALAQAKLTPQQAGVVNNTNPFCQFDCNWFVNDKPVVTMPKVDAGMTCSFEYMPNFYFMVAAPPLIGQTYIVQNFSDMTKYVMPISATSVNVSVSKNQGRWEFDFLPIE